MDRLTDGFNAALLLVYRLATASLGFVVATVVLGGPFGLTPALAGLMAVTRGWRAGEIGAAAMFVAVWRAACGAWRRGLPALLPVVVLVGLLALVLEMPSPATLALLIVGGAWSGMAIHHMALRLSFGLAAWGGGRAGWTEYVVLGWWHLLAVIGWLAVVVLLPLSPPLVVLFAPAALAFGLQVLAERAPAGFVLVQGRE